MQPLSKLMLYGAGGFVACLVMAKLFKNRVSEQIHMTPVFQEAMDRLRESRGAKYLLGHPITDSTASFAGPGLAFRDHSEVKVYVSGPKSNGILFFKSKPDKDEVMQLDTVQLQVGKDNSKRLVIKKSDEPSPVS